MSNLARIGWLRSASGASLADDVKTGPAHISDDWETLVYRVFKVCLEYFAFLVGHSDH